MSDILTAISRGCRGTLVDGSVRYTIEFGPLEAVAAATLFGMPGTEMGVVALKDGRALNVGLGDETTAVRPNDAGLTARADHTNKPTYWTPIGGVLTKGWGGEPYTNETQEHGDHNTDSGDETTAVRPNDVALPMASDQVADASKTIAKHITLANYAGIFCNDPKFWEWIGTKTNKPTCEAEAAHYIRWRCNIASRAEIDNSKIASEIFRQIMREFDEWRKLL